MEWMTVNEASELWNISGRRVQILCTNGKREDCIKLTAPITKPGECPWSPCLFGLIDKFGVNWCVFV